MFLTTDPAAPWPTAQLSLALEGPIKIWCFGRTTAARHNIQLLTHVNHLTNGAFLVRIEQALSHTHKAPLRPLELTLTRQVGGVLLGAMPRLPIAFHCESHAFFSFDDQVYALVRDFNLRGQRKPSRRERQRHVHLEPAVERAWRPFGIPIGAYRR